MNITNAVNTVNYIERVANVSHTQVANNDWEDWDLSATIGTGAHLVFIKATTGTFFGRRKGSSYSPANAQPQGTILAVEPSSGVIQVKATAGVDYYYMGHIQT